MTKTTGTVTELKRLWWIKINTKPARKHALDGALFLHRGKVRYTANGTEYEKWTCLWDYRKWYGKIPEMGQSVSVECRDGNPAKFKIVC